MIEKSDDQFSIFSILDAARIFGEMEPAQTLQTNFLSLYMGQNEESLASVAPYLFAYEPKGEFGKWLFEKGWGNSWGIFIVTPITMEELHKHLRKFLLVKTEDGKELYFRFYDPRVLRVFLPTCDTQQLKEFFGPVQQFICEDEDASFAFLFSFNGQKLVTERVAVDNIFPTITKPDEAAVASSPNETYKQDTVQQEVKPKRNFFY